MDNITAIKRKKGLKMAFFAPFFGQNPCFLQKEVLLCVQNSVICALWTSVLHGVPDTCKSAVEKVVAPTVDSVPDTCKSAVA